MGWSRGRSIVVWCRCSSGVECRSRSEAEERITLPHQIDRGSRIFWECAIGLDAVFSAIRYFRRCVFAGRETHPTLCANYGFFGSGIAIT
jgi:hypothetical protein